MYMEKYVSITNNERICYETVNKCPICNSSIAPVEKSKFFNSDSKMYFFMFECPACNKGFITHYNYTNERKIKNLAKASIWIGNDETHYVRKYEDKDIKDLKRFISATVAYITYELIADSAQEFVNN